MLWLYLAVFAAASNALTNIIDKFAVDKVVRNPMAYYVFWGAQNVVPALLLMAILPGVVANLNVFALAAGAVQAVSGRVYLHAIQKEDISRIVPLLWLSPLFVLLMSIAFVGERLGQMQYFGILALVAGAMLISIRKSIGLSMGAMLAVAAAVIQAISSVLFKAAMTRTDMAAVIFWAWIGFSIVVAVLARGHVREFVSAARKLGVKGKMLFIFSTVLSLACMVATSYAYSLQAASLVAAAKATTPMFVFVFAVVASLFVPHLFSEEIGRKTLAVKLVAVLLIVAGVILVS